MEEICLYPLDTTLDTSLTPWFKSKLCVALMASAVIVTVSALIGGLVLFSGAVAEVTHESLVQVASHRATDRATIRNESLVQVATTRNESLVRDLCRDERSNASYIDSLLCGFDPMQSVSSRRFSTSVSFIYSIHYYENCVVIQSTPRYYQLYLHPLTTWADTITFKINHLCANYDVFVSRNAHHSTNNTSLTACTERETTTCFTIVSNAKF
jgi:hypothetical protein